LPPEKYFISFCSGRDKPLGRNEAEALLTLDKCLILYPGKSAAEKCIEAIAWLRAGALADDGNFGYEFWKN
jgi:hypothetical protein